MSVIDTILKVWHYVFGLMVGVTLFYLGTSRISMGIKSVEDAYTVHFMNVGLLYVQISLLILIAIAVSITHSLTKTTKTITVTTTTTHNTPRNRRDKRRV
ncbi:MAG TPA: hypothetical protein VJJ82_02030 [Candidatus Nanoarchaeia archaeon]|nr:hypothetical protein [Candidatus Nanoarchaeia archaeon]